MQVKLPDIGTLISQVRELALMIAGLVIAVMILGTTMRVAGHPVPYIPAPSEQVLAWLAGAWCLFRFR